MDRRFASFLRSRELREGGGRVSGSAFEADRARASCMLGCTAGTDGQLFWLLAGLALPGITCTVRARARAGASVTLLVVRVLLELVALLLHDLDDVLVVQHVAEADTLRRVLDARAPDHCVLERVEKRAVHLKGAGV